MLDTIEFALRMTFFAFSIMWAGRIMILRTDKQIVINPLLIIISSILVMLPPSSEDIFIFGVSVQSIKITLYCAYLIICIGGIYETSKKDGIF